MAGIGKEEQVIVSILTLLLLLGVASLVGCGGHIVVGEEEVFAPTQAASMKAQLASGITARGDVHKLFGIPVVSSETWKFELYRIDHEDDYGIYTWAIIPIPFMPTWFEAASQTIYVLVAYDESWKVSDFDTGYFVEDIYEIRGGQRKDAETKDFLFEVDTVGRELEQGSEWLYARESGADAVLRAKPQPGFCTIYLTNSGVSTRLFLDSDIYLNPRRASSDGFVAVSSLPGKHEIKVIPYYQPMGSLDYKGESTTEVSCSDGERLFVEIKAEIVSRKSLFSRNTLTAEFVVSNEPFGVFKTRPLILYHNGKWLGPEKPNSDQQVQ